MKVLFTGGGTGGHLMPIVAISRELKKIYPKEDLKLYYIGPKDTMARALLFQENFKMYSVLSGKIRRYFSFKNITDLLFNIPFGFLQSFFLLLFIRPNLVFSKGGSGSTVVSYAARIFGMPIFLHESDVAPGLSNKTVAPFAKKIFISFPKTEYFDFAKTILSGNPTRQTLLDGEAGIAKEIFNLTLEKPIILFLGGSQGAQIINEFTLLVINEILKDYEVIHISGPKNYQKTKLEGQLIIDKSLEKYYHLYDFLDENQLKHAYRVCNLIVSRAGSGSIFEIAALGKPSILVPLPSAAGNHQYKNAYQYAKTGASIVMEQDNLTPNLFLSEVRSLLYKSDKIKSYALEFSKPQAAQFIAEEIINYLINDGQKKQNKK